MKIFQKNQHHSNMFPNSGPQHPTAHVILRFTNNFNTKSFSYNIKTTQILSVNDDIDRRDYLHIWEFLEVISNLDANRRQSRLIQPSEILTLERDSTENQPEVNVSGLWFKHAKTNLWSMLVFSDLSNKDIEQMLSWRESTTIDIKDDYIFHRLLKTKDISNQDKYSFQYNNKSYEMDGTLDCEFVYQIVNNELLLDPKIIQNFFDGLNVNPDSTDFDWLATLVAETGPQPTQTFVNQQIGIMLPALFNNNARYQIYIHSACAIQPVGKDKKIKEWAEFGNAFFPIRKLEIPAPVKFSERKCYYDSVEECYEMDGSIAAETWSSVLEHGARERGSSASFHWMSDYLTNFYRLRALARLQGIKHQNRDWVIHILASLLVAESANAFSSGMGIELGNVSKKLTIKEIIKLVGYYFPVYDCIDNFNHSLEVVSERHQKWLKDEKIRKTKNHHKPCQLSNQSIISSNSMSKRCMGGKALKVFAEQMCEQLNASFSISPGNKLITQYLIDSNVNKILGSKNSHFLFRSLEKTEYFNRRPALSTHAGFSVITKKDIQTNFDGRKGIFFPNQETIDSLNQSLSPDVIYDVKKKFPLVSFCSHKSVTRADIPISHWSTIELIDKFNSNQQVQIQKHLEQAFQNGAQLLLDIGPTVESSENDLLKPAILTEVPMFLNFELLKQFFEFEPYVKHLDISGVEVQKLGESKSKFSECIPALTRSLDRNIGLVSEAGIDFVNTDFQYTDKYLTKQAKVSVHKINTWLNNLPEDIYWNLFQTATNYK